MEYKIIVMKRKIYISTLVVLYFLFFTHYVKAQEEAATGYSHSIYVIGRSYEDSVKLRWAPASPVAWHYLNKYGYTLERYLIVKDNQVLQIPQKVDLITSPLKPAPLDQWEPFAETNDYIGISAQAIYGESFEVSTNQSSGMMQMINKSRDIEARYSFALFSADISPKVAELSGLMYIDKNVYPNEKYLYKVISAVPQDLIKIDTGYIYIGTDEYKTLPKPRDLKAYFTDKTALVSWEHRYNELFYIAYSLERSDDGKLFKPLSNLPLINTRNEANDIQDYIFRIDSLPENYKNYYYRVRGINSFGEYGPYSDTISGMGYKIFAANPAIVSSKVMANKYVQLNWEFPDSLNHLIKGFQIQRGEQDKGHYDNLFDTLLPKTERRFTDMTTLTTNYYKVVAIDQRDEGHTSFPYIVLLIDSIPPVPPAGLMGDIDTSGIVTLNWDKNSEPDLLGYRVFRANHKTDEFSQVTKDPVSVNQFIDTINIKTLTKNIYYKLSAVDQHFNPSDFSEILELHRPDKIPPVQAVFTQVTTDEYGIHLSWINSSSEDVEKHILYRRTEQDDTWRLVNVFNITDSISNYNDTISIPGTIYQYTLLAVDENGLESKPSNPVKMRAFEKKIRPPVKDIKFRADRDNKLIYITWEYPYDGVSRFLIYRALNDEPLNLHNSVSYNNFEFEDIKLKPNNNFSYRIKVVYVDGTQSAFSEKFEVKF